jgi:hypothetical protein
LAVHCGFRIEATAFKAFHGIFQTVKVGKDLDNLEKQPPTIKWNEALKARPFG